MCQEGPTALCYPQGKWYRGVTADKIDALIDHIHSGNPQPHPQEFAVNPLSRSK